MRPCTAARHAARELASAASSRSASAQLARARACRAGCRPGTARRARRRGVVVSLPSKRPSAGAQVVGQRRLARQQELPVEHGAGGAGDVARRRRVQPDAAVDVDRACCSRASSCWSEHERALLADPAAGLLALGDDAVGARRLRAARASSSARRDDVAAQPGGVRTLDHRGCAAASRRQQHRIETIGGARRGRPRAPRSCRRARRSARCPARTAGAAAPSPASRSLANSRLTTPSAPARLPAIGTAASQ